MPKPDLKPPAERESLAVWAQAFRAWVFQKALPFWEKQGVDAVGGGFCEHLRLDGVAAGVPFKRLRVQARQTYVFSHAALLGYSGGLDVAHKGYEFMSRHGQLSGGAWARRMGREGGVIDSTADLYDLAFVLFAIAWYVRAGGTRDALQQAETTLDWIEANLSHPLGGFLNTLPVEAGPRQQNPHMHLLEALLALYETSGERRYLRVADDIVKLFRAHFFEAATGTLGEFFNEDLSTAAGAPGDHIEPGHHFEWVWLLNEYSKATGEETTLERHALYDFAERYGVKSDSGAILDAVGRDGHLISSTSRLWPQTEAIKAHVVMLAERKHAATRLVQCLSNLLGAHFEECPPGTWREQFDTSGKNLVDKIPSSSFYHVFMAFGELERLRTK